jgi:hypothetical protein
MERLRQVLAADASGREQKWAHTVDRALARVEEMLQHDTVFALAPGGTLDQVEGDQPRLSRQTTTLSRDYGDLLENSAALREEVRCASGNVPAATITVLRSRGEQFLDDLHKTTEAQNLLLMDSLNTDIGAGD